MAEKYYIEETTIYSTFLNCSYEDPEKAITAVTRLLMHNALMINIDYAEWSIVLKKEDGLLYISIFNEDYSNLDRTYTADLNSPDTQEQYNRICSCMREIADICHFK